MKIKMQRQKFYYLWDFKSETLFFEKSTFIYSHDDCIKLGDANTKYILHKALRKRKVVEIQSLTSLDGNKTVGPRNIV